MRGCWASVGSDPSRGRLPVEDRGHRVRRRVEHGRRACVPRRAIGQRGEAGVAHAIDPPVAAQQRGEGELVEDDHHDRRARARAGRGHVRVLRQHQLRHVRAEQEEREEEQRRRGEHGDERPREGLAAHDQGPAQGHPGGCREREVEPRRQRADPLDELDGDERAEQRDDDGVHGVPDARPRQAGEPDDAGEHERRQQHERRRRRARCRRSASRAPRRTPGCVPAGRRAAARRRRRTGRPARARGARGRPSARAWAQWRRSTHGAPARGRSSVTRPLSATSCGATPRRPVHRMDRIGPVHCVEKR